MLSCIVFITQDLHHQWFNSGAQNSSSFDKDPSLLQEAGAVAPPMPVCGAPKVFSNCRCKDCTRRGEITSHARRLGTTARNEGPVGIAPLTLPDAYARATVRSPIIDSCSGGASRISSKQQGEDRPGPVGIPTQRPASLACLQSLLAEETACACLPPSFACGTVTK